MNIPIALALLTTLAHHSLSAPGERIQTKPCEPGSTWKEECHSCYCTEDRKTACSKEACPPQLVPRNRREISRRDCKEGESWKEDCHTCYCPWDKPACTREVCPSETGDFKVVPPGDQVQTTEAPCDEGNAWKDDCHTCHCIHGRTVCTREICPSEAEDKATLEQDKVPITKRDVDSSESDEADEKCPPEWKEICNECHCEDDGVKVWKVCALLQCYKKYHEQKCPPNVKEWKEDCNECYCGDDGHKVCTKMQCPDQDQGTIVAKKKPKE